MGSRLLSLVAALLFGCHFGDAFEVACIKGRLAARQAEAVNAQAWERRPGYCRGETYTDDAGAQREGQAHCEAEAGDRILAAHCSLALRALREGD